jgi:EAL domain-containing protein (putative c-di-GMP-specific phosphodiesterase class I)
MARQNKDALIVRAMVQLGQALGLETIAEGVEDAAVAELLRALGCTAAQGWLYGKAVPAEMFAAHFSAVPTPRRAVPTVSFERAAS